MQNETAQRAALSLIVGRLEDFARQVRQRMAAVDWSMQRELIRLLVKRVEIDREDVTVVLRVTPTPTGPGSPNLDADHVLHHCGRGDSPLLANMYLHYAFDLWMTRTHPAFRRVDMRTMGCPLPK